MTAAPAPFDWSAIRLVAFDVDGTLYRQRPVRLRMAAELALDAVARRRTETIRTLSHYRRIRERLGDEETERFGDTLLAATAQAASTTAEAVRETVEEWIERRPLRHLAAARYDGLGALFEAVRRGGRIVGILSDYPVTAKLAALGLAADHVASAADADLDRLKPHPAGLSLLMARAGVTPAQTVLIGDRPERDGMAARRAGAAALIRTSRPAAGWRTFRRFDDPLFAPLLAEAAGGARRA